MKLLQKLEAAFGEMNMPGMHELRYALGGLNLEPEEIKPFVTEPDGLPYGRNAILRTDSLEIVVIHVPAGSTTLIHDHGVSVGCGLVMEGELVNTNYVLDRFGYAEPRGDASLASGQYFAAPAGQIHRMSNRGDCRLVSLHVYAPPINGANRYEAPEYVYDFVI